MRDCKFGQSFNTDKNSTITLGEVAFVKNSIKHYYLACSKCSSLLDIFPEGFTAPYTRFSLKQAPCLCSKAPKLTDTQLILSLNIDKGAHTALSTNGLTGAKKRLNFSCSVCKEDPELYGEGIFTCKVTHFKDGVVSCGCSASYRRSNAQKEVVANRRCNANAFILKGFSEKGIATIYNPITDNTWSVPFNSLMQDKHLIDPALTYSKRSDSLSTHDHQHIEAFNETRSFSEGTKFIRTDDRGRKSNERMWEVACSDCKEVYQSGLHNLKRGQRGCSCADKGGYSTEKLGHLYIVRWSGEGKSYLKFGITNRSVQQRVNDQVRRSRLNYEILFDFHNEDGNIAANVEKEIKKSIVTKVCPKELLPDDYTETCENTIDNLTLLLYIINKSELQES